MPAKKSKKNSFLKRRFNRPGLLVFTLVFGAIGVAALVRSFAASTGRITVNRPAVAIKNAGGNNKYWIVTDEGGVFTFGGAAFKGSLAGKTIAQPITAMQGTGDSQGYWLLGGDGGVFAFGNAGFFGSSPGAAKGTWVSIIRTPTDKGYWLISKYGQIKKFGDAQAYSAGIDAHIKANNTVTGGKLPGLPTDGIVGAARSDSGKGLVLLASNGSVYAYGDMKYRGNAKLSSTQKASAIINGGSSTYTITTRDGSIYNFGSTYRGGANQLGHINGPIIALAATPGVAGYWQLGSDGGVYGYGDAKFVGNVEAPVYKTCWNNTKVLSTQSCPPKMLCWDQKTYVTDLSKCPAKPVVQNPASSGGGSGGGGGGCSATGEVANLQRKLGICADGKFGDQTKGACIYQWTRLTASEQAVCSKNGAKGSGGACTSNCGPPPVVNYCSQANILMSQAESGYNDAYRMYTQLKNSTGGLGTGNSPLPGLLGETRSQLNAILSEINNIRRLAHAEAGFGCAKAVTKAEFEQIREKHYVIGLGLSNIRSKLSNYVQ